MANKELIKILVLNDLKVTPQRVAILEVIQGITNHPTADLIAEYLRFSHPNISIATIYKTLDTFSQKGIISKIHTYEDSARYDPVQEKHYHLYCSESERIEDFYDDELAKILDTYLKKKKFPDFRAEDIKLQIIGKFTDSKTEQ